MEGVREALPKTTALSVLVRGQVTTDANDGGVTLALLTEHFDRIYVETTAEQLPALTAALEPYDAELVPILSEAPASGSYLLTA